MSQKRFLQKIVPEKNKDIIQSAEKTKDQRVSNRNDYHHAHIEIL